MADTATGLLWEAFSAHGLYPSQHEGWLFPDHKMPMVRAIWHPNNDPRTGQLDIQVVFEDGRVLTESLGGWQEWQNAASGLADAFANFLGSSFHVMLSALWDRHDPEQVDIERWSINGRLYDVFLGGARIRSLNGAVPALPENSFPAVREAIHTEQLTQPLHWVDTFFCWTHENKKIYEAHVDNVPWQRGEKAIEQIDWPPTGSMWSVRQFLMLKSVQGNTEPQPPGSQERAGLLGWLKRK